MMTEQIDTRLQQIPLDWIVEPQRLRIQFAEQWELVIDGRTQLETGQRKAEWVQAGQVMQTMDDAAVNDLLFQLDEYWDEDMKKQFQSQMLAAFKAGQPELPPDLKACLEPLALQGCLPVASDALMGYQLSQQTQLYVDYTGLYPRVWLTQNDVILHDQIAPELLPVMLTQLGQQTAEVESPESLQYLFMHLLAGVLGTEPEDIDDAEAQEILEIEQLFQETLLSIAEP